MGLKKKINSNKKLLSLEMFGVAATIRDEKAFASDVELPPANERTPNHF